VVRKIPGVSVSFEEFLEGCSPRLFRTADPEIADALGCSVGTVKSQASRGLARLRDSAEPDAAARAGQIGRRSLS